MGLAEAESTSTLYMRAPHEAQGGQASQRTTQSTLARKHNDPHHLLHGGRNHKSLHLAKLRAWGHVRNRVRVVQNQIGLRSNSIARVHQWKWQAAIGCGSAVFLRGWLRPFLGKELLPGGSAWVERRLGEMEAWA